MGDAQLRTLLRNAAPDEALRQADDARRCLAGAVLGLLQAEQRDDDAGANEAALSRARTEHFLAAVRYRDRWRDVVRAMEHVRLPRSRAPLCFAWRHTAGGDAGSVLEHDTSLLFESAASELAVAAAALALDGADDTAHAAGVAATQRVRDVLLATAVPLRHAATWEPLPLETALRARAARGADLPPREPALLSEAVAAALQHALHGARARALARGALRDHVRATHALMTAAAHYRAAHALLPGGAYGVASARCAAYGFHMLARALAAESEVGGALACVDESLARMRDACGGSAAAAAAAAPTLLEYRAELERRNRVELAYQRVPPRDTLRVTLGARDVARVTLTRDNAAVDDSMTPAAQRDPGTHIRVPR